MHGRLLSLSSVRLPINPFAVDGHKPSVLSSRLLAADEGDVVQNYEVYCEMIGDDELPPLQSPIDVWRSVEPFYIAVPPYGQTMPPTFLLFAECGWDSEHGLVIRFRNGYADASNQQGELGVED